MGASPEDGEKERFTLFAFSTQYSYISSVSEGDNVSWIEHLCCIHNLKIRLSRVDLNESNISMFLFTVVKLNNCTVLPLVNIVVHQSSSYLKPQDVNFHFSF